MYGDTVQRYSITKKTTKCTSRALRWEAFSLFCVVRIVI